VEELIIWYRDNSDLSLKDASRRLAGDLGLSRSQIYQQALNIWKERK
jgi:16S rRNA (cytidine1402-2'-O)-methyltransferase